MSVPVTQCKLHICYHYKCPDGIAACFATFLGLTADVPSEESIESMCKRVNIVFHPLEIYKPASARIDMAKAHFGPDDTVYIVDFSGGVEFLLTCASLAKRVVMLDHHKTAQEDIAKLSDVPSNLEIHFDMNRSGCGLARDYFHIPSDERFAAKYGAERLRNIVLYLNLTEENDLWRHIDPRSKDFAAGFNALEWELDASKHPEVMQLLLNIDVDTIVRAGKIIRDEEAIFIDEELKKAVAARITVPGDVPQTLNCLAIFTERNELRSILGNELALKSKLSGLHPAAIIAYKEMRMGEAANTTTKVSFRSLEPFDTTIFSKHFGGGGHMCASSCIVADEVYNSWLLPQ